MTRDKNRKRRILVVEPDREFRRMLHDFLSAQRFEVARASKGDEALDKAESFSPDIVLLSRELPMNDGALGPDGLRVLKVLKQDRGLTQLPIILTSAVAADGDFDRYRKLKFTADDYVRKPFEDTEILRRIENLVGFDLSDGEDLDRIKAKIDTVVRPPQNGDFFHAETDTIGPSISAATRQEITQLLEQVGAELERQETPAPANGKAPAGEAMPPAPAPAPDEYHDPLAELKHQLERVRRELQDERKRSKDLKREWKKKLTDIAGRLRETEDREAEIRDEFETMRQRFADLELDHTLELEREKETRRHVEEELLQFRKEETVYPRRRLQEDLTKLRDLLDQMVRRGEPPED
jgi:CheY-like chemotaxis protein